MPASAWAPSQAITVDTSRGAIDLEPGSEEEYATWVLGLNAAMTVMRNPQTLDDVSVPEMLWVPDLFVMSDLGLVQSFG